MQGNKAYMTSTKNSQGLPIANRKDCLLPDSSGGIASSRLASLDPCGIKLRSLPLLPPPPPPPPLRRLLR